MKKLLTLTLITVLLSGILTSCKQSELPPELTQAQDNANASVAYLDEYVIPTEYTKPYMTAWHGGYTVYKNNFYYCNPGSFIEYIELSELNSDLRGSNPNAQVMLPNAHSICNDPLCEHDDQDTCLAYVGGGHLESRYLIDEVESAGGNPIFYYYAATDMTYSTYEIYRIDSGAGKKELIATVKDPINKMAVMEDSIYFVTQSSDDTYKINMVKKSGGEVSTLSPNGEYLRMIGGNKDGIYLHDNQGNIYAVNSEFQSAEVIYTLKEIYPSSTGYYGAFVEGDYLYFYTDYEAVTFQRYNNQMTDYIKHNIRRVRIDSPEGEGELVAENVFNEVVLGVYNNVLYYGPFDVRVDQEYEDPVNFCHTFNHSNGTIIGVDLDTLEKTELVSDCGLNFSTGPHLITDKYLLGIIFPYRTGLGLDPTSSGGWLHLYVFETGEIYRLCNCMV